MKVREEDAALGGRIFHFGPKSRISNDLSYANNFNPTMEMMSVVRKKIRQKVTGSLKKMMPNNTAPMAPMPVHTA